MQPKLFIGPMSKNIVDAVIDYANSEYKELGLIASRRQIDAGGGYVSVFDNVPCSTKAFTSYVRKQSKNVLLVRDHAGPSQGQIDDDGTESFLNDCFCFDVIHIDPWKRYSRYEDGLASTISFIEKGSLANPFVKFEVGTEQSIKEFTPELLDKFVLDLKNRLRPKIFDKIKYLVIQSGTSLKQSSNTGEFCPQRLKDMITVCKKHDLISKEHNGDYLTTRLIKRKFKLGLDSINIAPEFGQIESKVLTQRFQEMGDGFVDAFFNICKNSGKWEKWVDKHFIPDDNKIETINICGHYVFSYPSFQILKQRLGKDVNIEIQQAIKKRIKEII